MCAHRPYTERTWLSVKALSIRPTRLRCSDETQLLQRCHTIIQPDLFDDPAVLETKYRRPREMHLPAGGHWQRADQKIAESRAGVRTAARPTANDMITLGNQIGDTPKIQIRK